MASCAAAQKKFLHATVHGISVIQLSRATAGVQTEEAMMSIDRRINARPTQCWRPA